MAMSELSDAVRVRLDELEGQLDQRADPSKIANTLHHVLSVLSVESEHRPRVLRLSGVAKNRRKLYREALADLSEAKAAAMVQRNYSELAKIGREVSLIYAWRGDDRAAGLELLHALALFSLEGNRSEIAKTLVALGRIELEARRFDRVAMLLGLVASTASKDLPPREVHHMTINLCQALNGLGKHAEVLSWTGKLQHELHAADARLQFLVRLEEARAFAGLGRIEVAGGRLRGAGELILNAKGDAFEQFEYKEAEAELRILRNDPSVVETLKAVMEEFVDQGLVVRAANINLAPASVLLKVGKDESAREVLSFTLRSALNANLVELADRVRAEMIKSAGAGQLAELAEVVELIGGQSSVDRRFILLERLGQGGSGEVYKALDLSNAQHVALKKLDLKVYNEERRKHIINTIRTEYGVALSFVHPGFARVRDLLIEPRGTIYIVQEFIDGPTLRQLYASGVGATRLQALLADVADSLFALHSKGIVHRDLKPENVVVRGGSSPVLVDLGIASIAGQADEFKHVGTPGYISPEQARGDYVDYRADVYALGKMIAEIWGHVGRPFTSVFSGWVTGRDTAPRAVLWLVRRMLRTDPNHRLGDLKVIASTLRTGKRAPDRSRQK
jgi:serine/threonine-protein kinase